MVGLLLFAALWELFSAGGSLLLPSLGAIAGALLDELRSGRLIPDAVSSTIRVISGVGVATLVSLLLGIISGLCATFPSYLRGIVELARPIPPIAWTPVAIIAFGIGNAPAIAIVGLGAFFPIWLGVLQGISEVKQSHLRAAYSLGCGKWLVLTDIIFPSALPYFAHGLRLGVGLGWFCVVAAEMMGASSGLGYGVQLFSLNLEMEKLYAYLFSIGAIGYLSHLLFEYLDKRAGAADRV